MTELSGKITLKVDNPQNCFLRDVTGILQIHHESIGSPVHIELTDRGAMGVERKERVELQALSGVVLNLDKANIRLCIDGSPKEEVELRYKLLVGN